MLKKFSLVIASFALALGTLGFTSGSAFAKTTNTSNTMQTNITAGQTVDFANGREGIYIPKADFNGELEVTKMAASQVSHEKGLRIEQPLIQYQVNNANNVQDTYLPGRTYIYFDLTNSQLKAWQNGDLSIYSYNSSAKTWTPLSTFEINRGNTSGERIAAVATQYGIYGLGAITSASNSSTTASSSAKNQGANSTISTNIAVGQTVDFSNGREGVYMQNSSTNGELDLSRMSTTKALHTPQGVRFNQPVIDFQVDNANGVQDTYLHGLTYVYFNLSNSELNAWMNGTLAVYHYNSTTKTWSEMPSFQVDRGNTSGNRIAAVVTAYGEYGLGRTK